MAKKEEKKGYDSNQDTVIQGGKWTATKVGSGEMEKPRKIPDFPGPDPKVNEDVDLSKYHHRMSNIFQLRTVSNLYIH